MAPRVPEILVIEDDLCLKTVITKLILNIVPHANVTWLTSAEEAKLEKGYDLILSDLLLPGKLSGLDLCRLSAQSRSPAEFILMSGMPPEEFLRKFDRWESPPSFLPKPFRSIELIFLIRRFLRRRQRERMRYRLKA